jgi:hypothetical protein
MCEIAYTSTIFTVDDPGEFVDWLRAFWPEADFFQHGEYEFQIGPNYDHYQFEVGEAPTALPCYRQDPETGDMEWCGSSDPETNPEDRFLMELSHRLSDNETCIIQIWRVCSENIYLDQGHAEAVVINGGNEYWRDRVGWTSLEAECMRKAGNLAGGKLLLTYAAE